MGLTPKNRTEIYFEESPTPTWRREIRILQLVKFTYVLSSCLTDAVNVGLRYGGREDLDHDEGVHLGLWMGGVRGVGIQKV